MSKEILANINDHPDSQFNNLKVNDLTVLGTMVTLNMTTEYLDSTVELNDKKVVKLLFKILDKIDMLDSEIKKLNDIIYSLENVKIFQENEILKRQKEDFGLEIREIMDKFGIPEMYD